MRPSKVPYTLDTQIARYLDGDLGVYRPAKIKGLDDTGSTRNEGIGGI
jgi:hypothetical protein